MTAAELRTLLSSVPDDMPVAVRGYEADYDPLDYVAVTPLWPAVEVYFVNGVLTSEASTECAPRDHIVLGIAFRDDDVAKRLRLANVIGWRERENDRWRTRGWVPDGVILSNEERVSVKDMQRAMRWKPEERVAFIARFPRLHRESDWLSRLFDPSPCGRGWVTLLERVLTVAESESNVVVAQVKEKYGTLRVYLDGSTSDAFNQLVDEAEFASERICEACGEDASLAQLVGG